MADCLVVRVRKAGELTVTDCVLNGESIVSDGVEIERLDLGPLRDLWTCGLIRTKHGTYVEVPYLSARL